ncbi:RsmF rRNA methyltransferase first C-terminal domain-containing protein [Brevibacillus ginsengisoli]|uniref:RsmF rRNA methyltransferase first C-terminal domain-containing protein n=1 Tax=Brevibacillus ginsengisoli TaxID=363854 RepID=UPI003CEF68B8
MKTALPKQFVTRMADLLGNQLQAFLHTYEESPLHGLRINPLKSSIEELTSKPTFTLQSVPWCDYGFYYPASERPGKHPHHAAGLYYLQEPSAMAVAGAVGVEPGETILDLCAAPGGKSTQLAGYLQGDGLLISNEIHPTRAKALSENIERLGITNAIVTNETPERLRDHFPLFFDRILVDAPCSGEGMFRKLPEAIDDWSEEKVLECHRMQTDILDAAHQMLKPGGTLVYSTCTFAPLENERTIEEFLQNYPDYQLELVPHAELFAQGQPEWSRSQDPALSKTSRLWPHLLNGEGHYLAKLIKPLDDVQEATESSLAIQDSDQKRSNKKRMGRKSDKPSSGIPKEALTAWEAFASDALYEGHKSLFHNRFTLFGEQLYHLPSDAFSLNGLKIVRAGWHLGTVKKNRLEPSHALALAIRPEQAKRVVNFSADDPQIIRYLKGETLQADGPNGWTLVTVDGYSIGWGKLVDGQLKNHYPKGLRWV